MANSNFSYSQYFETLVALISYLGTNENEGTDSANAPKLAQHLGLDREDVEKVLNGFKGIFRRSEYTSLSRNYGEQYKYTLQLRYARRKYAEGKALNFGEPLSSEDLFSLLEFITNKINQEQENERHLRSNRITMVGVWVAAAMSMISVTISLLK